MLDIASIMLFAFKKQLDENPTIKLYRKFLLFVLIRQIRLIKASVIYLLSYVQGRREGGRAGNFYRGPRLNGGPEELDYGARNSKSMREL